MVFVFASWCILAVMAAVRFYFEPVYSAQERARLIAKAHPSAIREHEKLANQALLASAYRVIFVAAAGLFAWCCIDLFGTINGLLALTASFVVLPAVQRLRFVLKLSDKLGRLLEPFLQRAVSLVRPIFALLKEREISEAEPHLNSKEELVAFVKRSPGVISKSELERLEASLAFDDKIVSDIMTPRSMISAVPEKEVLGPLVLDELFKTGHSRFPVYRGDIDHMIGVLYLHDLLDFKSGNKTAMTAMQPAVYYIHENDSLKKALHGFLATKHHLFVVVNDYRETAGLISLEDVMEVLLGKKIVDEFDKFDDLRAVAEQNLKGNNEPKGKKDI